MSRKISVLTTEQYPIPKRLEFLRQQEKMTYSHLARLLGVTRQTAKNYCSGQTKTVPLDKIDLICQIFDVSREYLVSDSDVRAGDFRLRTACEFTGLSEYAVVNLSTTVARYTLSFMLEEAPEEFWAALNAYFSLSVPREPVTLEAEPLTGTIKTLLRQEKLTEKDLGPSIGSFRADKREIMEHVLLYTIEKTLERLKGSYFGWELEQAKKNQSDQDLVQ